MTISLDKYLKRLGLTTSPAATEKALFELQIAQLRNIPFENIDCLNHRPISIKPADLEIKLLQNGRGGYCFELNQLLMEGLLKIGFNVRPILSRVMYRGVGINPKTHIFLLVELASHTWIVDAGFGGPGISQPMLFELNRIDQQPNGSFRLVADKEFGTILQKLKDPQTDEWINVFAFNLDKVYPADLEMSNFYTSTLPESHFRQNLIAALFTNDGRNTLLNRKLMVTSNDGSTETSEIATEAELIKTLKEKFMINVPAEYQFNKLWSQQ